MAFIKENIIRLYTDDKSANGACLQIGPSPECPTKSLTLYTPDKVSSAWFGEINVILLPVAAIELGKALIEAAEAFEESPA